MILGSFYIQWCCASFWWSGIFKFLWKLSFLENVKNGPTLSREYKHIVDLQKMRNCPGAWSGPRKIISGSPEGHLKQNFEVSPLGHLPEPKIHEKNKKNPTNPGFQAICPPSDSRSTALAAAMLWSPSRSCTLASPSPLAIYSHIWGKLQDWRKHGFRT